MILGRLSEEQKRIEKLRRQKRKRSKRTKLKVLEAKRRQGFAGEGLEKERKIWSR